MADSPHQDPNPAAPNPAAPNPAAPNADGISKKDYYIIGVILAAALAAIFLPNVVVRPAQQSILFFLVAILGAILMGRQAQAYFEFKKGGYFLAIAGIWVVISCVTAGLHYLSRPQFRVAIYSFSFSGAPLTLERNGAILLQQRTTGSSVPEIFKDGNTALIRFPEQTYEVIAIITTPDGQRYRGQLDYRGDRESSIELTDDENFHKIQ